MQTKPETIKALREMLSNDEHVWAWEWMRPDEASDFFGGIDGAMVHVIPESVMSDENADLMCAAHNALPELLDDLEAMMEPESMKVEKLDIDYETGIATILAMNDLGMKWHILAEIGKKAREEQKDPDGYLDPVGDCPEEFDGMQQCDLPLGHEGPHEHLIRWGE